MTDKARIRIAALVTALFLAAVSIAGVATRSREPSAATASPPAAAVQQSTPTSAVTQAASYEHEEREHDE